jgi:hypothetical protein
MAGMDTLEKLVTGLSLEERQTMFEKLRAQSTISNESLYPIPPGVEAEPALSAADRYAKLPWYYRVYYFILGFFKNKAPHQVFMDAQIGRLGHRVDLEYPDMYNYQTELLLTGFYRLLAALKEDARFFFDALDVSVNRDRGCFFSFLGSLEMGAVHRRLETETDPERLREKNPAVPDADLRQAALRVMEEAFAGITEAQRTTMYRNARSLYCLKELASFLYDRVLLAFAPGEGNQTCSIHAVKDMLGSLNNILVSLRDPPALTLLESLFIFILQERSSEPGFDRNQELRRLLVRAESALVNIRNFNRYLPLTLILKCGNRDMSYGPRPISGGEDWYAVYRDYWRRFINARCAAYMKDRHYRDLQESYKRFFPREEPLDLVNLENAASEKSSDGFPLGLVQSLSFLLSFYKQVFVPDINAGLVPMVADGEFINKENRVEFGGSYNDLSRLGNDIRSLDEKIGPEGIYGERYAQAWRDMSSLPVKRRKIQLVLDDANDEGQRIIDRTRTAIDSIVTIIAGIVQKDSGGKYDTLSNLSQLEARFPNFQVSLRNIGERLREAVTILDKVMTLETEIARN